MTNKVWVLTNTSTLVYGGEWKDAESSVRAKVFGHMVELAQDMVKFYKSDLFHDAVWLKEEMTGPMSFEWIARESGTHIGEICQYVKDDEFTNLTRYRFEVLGDEKSRWILNIYESRERVCTSDDPNNHQGDTCPVHEDLGAKYRDAMQKDIVKDGIIDMLFARPETKMGGWHSPDTTNIPTLGNLEHSVPERKENKMDDIIRDLRSKYEEASNSKDQLEEYQGSINDAVDELDTYMSDLDDLISNLDQLPEVSVYVDLDTVSFDS